MAKIKSYFRWLIVLLIVCILCVVVLIILLSLDKPNLNNQSEIQYLTVYLADEIDDSDKVEEIDSILIEGGVIKTSLSKEKLVDTGLLENSNINNLSPIDYLNSLLNYIGAFGWRLIEINDDIMHFYRSL